MKTKLFTIIVTFAITVTFAQQKLIAIKGTTTDAIATTLTEAITLAQPNDKIYLPGGFYDFAGTIDKPIHIIGTGFQDGMNVMGRTTINGNLNLNNLANGSVFEGFYLTDWFVPTNVLSNITFKRCNMKGLYVVAGCSFNNSNIINCVARETLHFGEHNTTLGQSNNISNSFVGTLYRTQYSSIKNCIVNNISECDNVFVKNNVFSGMSDCGFQNSSTNIVMANNLIFSGCLGSGYAGGISSEINSIPYNTINDVFINAANFQFNVTYDFQLVASSPGNNAGDDGTDIGIFGGQFPWKIGSLPINPNIEQNNSYLDVNAEQFKLRVKVVPQTH